MSNFILSGFADEINENFDIQLQSLNKLGINYIEIRGVDGRNISTYSIDEIKIIKQKLDFYHIRVSAIGSPIGKVYIKDDLNKHFEIFKKIIEAAKKLETKYIRLFSFYMEKNQNSDELADEVIRRLKIFVEYAKKHNIILLHENEKDIYGDIPERCLNLVRSINDSSFRLIFDFANFIQCGVNTLDAYKLLKDYIIYFHIKDALSNGTVVPAGVGDGHIKEILFDKHKANYNGFVSLEPHLGHFKGLQDLELDLKINEIDDNGFARFKLAYDELVKILNQMKE